MSAGDWNMGTRNTGSTSIVDESGDKVLRWQGYSNNQYFDMFYNGRNDLIDTEIDFKGQWETLNSGGPTLIARFRCSGIDINNLSGVKVRLNAYLSGDSMTAIRVNAGSETTIGSVAISPGWSQGAWYRFRIRVWDIVFPANNVRYTLEQWNGLSWDLRGTITDSAGFRYGVGGLCGVGARFSYFQAYGRARWNDIAIGEMS